MDNFLPGGGGGGGEREGAGRSQVFFLNNVGDTIFFNSVGKMSHIINIPN